MSAEPDAPPAPAAKNTFLPLPNLQDNLWHGHGWHGHAQRERHAQRGQECPLVPGEERQEPGVPRRNTEERLRRRGALKEQLQLQRLPIVSTGWEGLSPSPGLPPGRLPAYCLTAALTDGETDE